MSEPPRRGLRPIEERATQRPPAGKGPAPGKVPPPPPPGAHRLRHDLPPGSESISTQSVRRVVDLDPIGRFGDYDILGRLAVGGMAEILLARHRSAAPIGRPVVVKKILAHFADEEEFVQMFEDEARLGLALQHPNIVRFHDAGVFNGQHFIEMEWIDGQQLGRLIRRARDLGGIPVPLAVSIVAQVADALEHAHSLRDEMGRPMGVIHRDVSPHNILVGFDGEVKLLDFGIAKADTQRHRTRAGVVKGKFSYMAPEQCRGKAIDHRVDIFALGVVLYETLTGYVLYRRDTEAATMQAVVSAPVPKLAERVLSPPPELERIVQKALAKSPDDRYQTAGAFRDDLMRFLDAEGWTASRDDLARLMRVSFPDELGRGPRVDSTPFGSSQVVSVDDGPEVRVPRATPMLPSGTRELDDLGSGGPLPEAIEAASVDIDLVPVGGDIEATTPPRYEPIALATDPEPGEARRAPSRPRAAQRPRAAAPKRGWGWSVALVLGVVAVVGLGLALWRPWANPPASPPVEPPPPVAPAAAHGTLLIASVPPGAEVSLDGRAMGVTPLEVRDVEPGSHRVRVGLSGYAPWEQEVVVGEGDSELLTARLEEAVEADWSDPRGRLTLETRPSGVRVSIGDRELGTTPLQEVPVPLGTFPVTLEAPHGEVYRVRVNVDGDETLSLDLADLQR